MDWGRDLNNALVVPEEKREGDTLPTNLSMKISLSWSVDADSYYCNMKRGLLRNIAWVFIYEIPSSSVA